MSRIAFVLANDFEDSEFRIPYAKLVEAGHEVTILGAEAGETVKGKLGKESATIERACADANPSEFDALVIPGGYSPDHLRTDLAVVKFVSQMVAADKWIAAVCHGPQLLIEADAVEGKTLTSWPSVRTDLVNAGAHWVDKEVAIDGHLITSRKPDDLNAFSAALRERLRT